MRSTAPAPAPSRASTELSSVRNATRLLCAFTPSDSDLGVTELASRVGLPKSNVHRLLTTLTADGFIERSSTPGRYRLGLKLYELGTIVSDHMDLHEVVAGPIDDLRNRTSETVHVAILDGAEVVYIARRESRHNLRLFGRVGYRNEAHCTSTGKVLLAYLPPDERDRVLRGRKLAAHTPYTITDRPRLEAELDVVRARGWAENVNESEMGVHSVAAPIFDVSGRVVAAISVAGPGTRFTPDTLRRFAAETVRAAEFISERLGYRVARAEPRPLVPSGQRWER